MMSSKTASKQPSRAAGSPQKDITAAATALTDPSTNEIRESNMHELNNGILRAIRLRELEMQERERNGNLNMNLQDTETELEKDQNSILSPHNSVFEALHNPDLNRGVDLSTIKSRIILNNNNSSNSNIEAPIAATMSQLHIQYNQDHDPNNLDFSITSWQNVSSYFNPANPANTNNFDSRSNSQSSSNNTHPFAFNMASNNNSNIISSGNNSPYLKNNDDTFSSSTPNRIDSPNVASILSGVSGHEDDGDEDDDKDGEEDDDSIDGLQIIQTETETPSRSQAHSHHHRSKSLHNTNDTLIYDSDTDLDRTVDSSTIISSFVMPRVSIHSNINTSNSVSAPPLTTSSISRSKLNIRIVGHNNKSLMNRFQSYKKTLTNIDFYVTNCEFTDLIILIVDNDNYMLPKITKTPCIPIVLSSNDVTASNKIPNYLKLCDAIRLNSLNDDLIILIDFLSNINDLDTWRSFLSNFPMKAHSANITDVNSSLIEFHSENRINASLLPFSKESVFIKKNKNDQKKASASSTPSNVFIIAGVAVGLLSLGIIFVWKKLSATELIQNPTKETITASIPNHKAITITDIDDSSKLSFDRVIISKLKTVTNTIEYLGDVAFSQGVILFQKAKLILIELLNF